MKTKLPNFDGQHVKAARLKLSGKSDERVGALALDEEAYVIVRCVCTHVDHGDVDGVLTRLHAMRATAVVLMDKGAGARMLDEASMLADERFGISNLFTQSEGDGEEPPPAP